MNTIVASKLEHYLHNIDWSTKHFNSKQLESMLAAGCLRYLGGLEDISFVLQLSKAISDKYRDSMHLSLVYATQILNDVSEEMQSQQLTNQEIIKRNIQQAQQLLTGIRLYN